MSGFALPLLAALAVACTLTGRLHVALLGPRRLHAFAPFAALVSAVIGTVWWMVLMTAGSAAGLHVPSAVSAALGVHVVAGAVVFIRRRQAVFRPVGRPRAWLGLLAPVLLAGLVGLLPVLRHQRFSTENDSLLYCSLAQWYQDHSFGNSADFRPDQPLAHYAAIYQGAGYPLAPAFLLAGTQVLARASSPLLVYPAVSTWGLVLAIGSLLMFGRRILRWPERWLLPAGLALAVLVQPLTWAHHMGFLAQTFATPLLLAALLQLGLTLAPRRWTPPEAMVAGLLAAGIAGTYPPFLPLLAGGWMWWMAVRVRRGWTDAGRYARFVLLAATIAAAVAVAQGLNLPRAFAFLRGTLVGGHVDLSPWGFVQATLGAWFWTPFRLPPIVEHLRAAHLWLVPVYAWLALRGLRVLAREPRGGPLLGCLTVLASAFIWYGLVAQDPWTAQRGHTWNLFKLTQWSYAPLVLALIHGLVALRRQRWGRWLGPILLLVPFTLLPVGWSLGGRLGAEFETFVGSSRPLVTWDALRRHFLGSPGSPAVRLLAADTPAATTAFLPTYLGQLTHPTRIAGDWAGALWIPPNPANEADVLWRLLDRGETDASGEAISAVATGLRGYVTDEVLLLGGGIGLVKNPGRASVLAVFPRSDTTPGPGGCVWLGRARSTFVAYSPREAEATLRLTASADPGHNAHIDLPIRLRPGVVRVQLALPADAARALWGRCVLSMTILMGNGQPP